MRQVPARQLQRHFYKEIKDLPVAVTSRGDKQFIISPYSKDLEDFIEGNLIVVDREKAVVAPAHQNLQIPEAAVEDVEKESGGFLRKLFK